MNLLAIWTLLFSLISHGVFAERGCDYDEDTKSADCASGGLTSVPTNLPKDIEVLHLGYNNITKLTKKAFVPYESLRRITLWSNGLETIEEGVFTECPNLEKIDLSFNKLRTLPNSLFQLEKLKELQLIGNQLDDALNITNVRAPALEYLHLGDNNLTEVPQLHPLPKLTRLYVSGNYIRRIAVEDLKRFSSLKYLYLDFNGLETIEEDTFSKCPGLETINLGENKLRTLPKSLFRLEKLKKLILHANQLDDGALNITDLRAPALEDLNLIYNKMTKLPQLQPLPKLKYLSVERNAIRRITIDDLKRFPSLKRLTMDYLSLEFNPDNGCEECRELVEAIGRRNITIDLEVTCPEECKEREYKPSSTIVSI